MHADSPQTLSFAADREPVEVDVDVSNAATGEGAAAGGASRTEELIEIVRAYNQVTDRLRESHEALNQEVARLQRELASANAALQRSKRLAALGEMAAGIAHEIRNPLASIQLYASMLRQDLTDRPEQQDVAGRIGEAVHGLNAIVGDVLTFSREMRVRRIEGSAIETFERAVQAVGPMLDERAIELRYAGEDALVCHDRELLHQALVNLIRNAVEAMGQQGTLTLGVAADEQGVDLIVRDSGPGIAPEQIDRIFNPFFTTRATGTGLGLAIVHRIVDAHGGTIAVHNDGGAVFTLRLPAGEPAGAGGGEADASPWSAQEA
jgi:signal transduction histidine kinase